MAEPGKLLLYNANVLTLDPRRPRARAVVCEDGRIIRVTDDPDSSRLKLEASSAIDCRGRTIMPGFIDSHTHFLAYASSLTSVDCSPRAVSSMAEVRDAISSRAREKPPGDWVKATGYDESCLAEGRHPSANDLDGATQQHPVKLVHRSGHACVLNSYAMRLAGITICTPEPLSGVMERDPTTGEPTGLFFDLDDWLDQRLGATRDAEGIDGAVRLASERYLSMGVTSFQDASVSNSLESWGLFSRLKSEGLIAPRITMMPGYRHLLDIVHAGLDFGAGGPDLRMGHAKVVLGQTSGRLRPPTIELKEIVRTAVSHGFPVAIHAVEEAEIEAAIDTVESAGEQGPGQRLRHRIEHCSVCPPPLENRLHRLGVVVVTQPGFIHHSGQRYLSQVPTEQLPWLYPIRSWREHGLRVAGSSDSPVAPPDPLVAIGSAVTRSTASGEMLGPAQAVSPQEALEMYTVDGAYASSQEEALGVIASGMLADLVILSGDPTRVEPGAIAHIEACGTIVGGRLLWQSS